MIRNVNPRPCKDPGKCRYCEKPFIRQERAAKFCSDECGRRHKNEKAKERMRQKSRRYEKKICKGCGAEFAGHKRKYCSSACSLKFFSRNCEACGDVYIPNMTEVRTGKHLKRRFCSHACSNKSNLGAVQVVCEKCGKDFVTQTRGAIRARFCSRQCQMETFRQTEEYKNKTRDRNHKRRAMILTVPYEDVDTKAIFERDNWICGICGEEIDGILQYPDPMSASHDHIIALADGGSHTVANSQAAHLRCNISKGGGREGTQVVLRI